MPFMEIRVSLSLTDADSSSISINSISESDMEDFIFSISLTTSRFESIILLSAFFTTLRRIPSLPLYFLIVPISSKSSSTDAI